jgi:hypothetical protein
MSDVQDVEVTWEPDFMRPAQVLKALVRRDGKGPWLELKVFEPLNIDGDRRMTVTEVARGALREIRQRLEPRDQPHP